MKAAPCKGWSHFCRERTFEPSRTSPSKTAHQKRPCSSEKILVFFPKIPIFKTLYVYSVTFWPLKKLSESSEL
ncbi:MAG: hypothetical protein CMO55_25165 [Verrucomicrobiales bacterium]|nr:hypothetical protein [Verrucomicrobiales bacterium]